MVSVYLQHVGEVCLKNGDDNEGIENPGHDEGDVVGHESGEDAAEGHEQQDGHQYPLAPVHVGQHPEREHAQHHAHEVERLGSDFYNYM